MKTACLPVSLSLIIIIPTKNRFSMFLTTRKYKCPKCRKLVTIVAFDPYSVTYFHCKPNLMFNSKLKMKSTVLTVFALLLLCLLDHMVHAGSKGDTIIIGGGGGGGHGYGHGGHGGCGQGVVLKTGKKKGDIIVLGGGGHGCGGGHKQTHYIPIPMYYGHGGGDHYGGGHDSHGYDDHYRK